MRFLDPAVQGLYDEVKSRMDCRTSDTDWDAAFRIAYQSVLNEVLARFPKVVDLGSSDGPKERE